jgi:TPR repeat protein
MEDLEQKERYASRSPLLFDTPGSSRLPSPGVVEERQQQQQAMRQPAVRQATFEENQPARSAAGMPLHSAIAKAKASLAKSGPSLGGSKGQTAQDYLQAGILAHEQGDLERSAGLFERAAREGGGCGAGMLMWGLSLRHGWGCQVHEARAFKWLQKAAESVIEDLDQSTLNPPPTTTTTTSSSKHLTAKSSAPASVDQSKDAVAKSELVLAIYELGQCFLRGWGCKKDKQLVRLLPLSLSLCFFLC